MWKILWFVWDPRKLYKEVIILTPLDFTQLLPNQICMIIKTMKLSILQIFRLHSMWIVSSCLQFPWWDLRDQSDVTNMRDLRNQWSQISERSAKSLISDIWEIRYLMVQISEKLNIWVLRNQICKPPHLCM